MPVAWRLSGSLLPGSFRSCLKSSGSFLTSSLFSAYLLSRSLRRWRWRPRDPGSRSRSRQPRFALAPPSASRGTLSPESSSSWRMRRCCWPPGPDRSSLSSLEISRLSPFLARSSCPAWLSAGTSTFAPAVASGGSSRCSPQGSKISGARRGLARRRRSRGL